MNESKIITGVWIFFVLMFIISLFTSTFSLFVFFGVIVFGVAFTGFYHLTIYLHNNEIEEYETSKKEKLDYSHCFKRINVNLRKVDPNSGIEWDKEKYIYRYFPDIDNNTKKPYAALISQLSNTYELIRIIFDIEADNLVVVEVNPSPQSILNPFHDFKPIDNQGMGVMNGMMPRLYGKNGKLLKNLSYGQAFNPNPGFNLSFGGGGYMPPQEESYRPSDSETQKILDNLNK